MVIPKIVVCPICGKKTYLRIEDGGYLNEYPIRINCMNCKALIKGKYVMNSVEKNRGLHLYNAESEECIVDSEKEMILNADYVAEVSGELPCNNIKVFNGKLIKTTPFIEAAGNIESIQNRIERLKSFTNNMSSWNKRKSTAFQLLEDGSVEYIAIALNNKMGEYVYECDNYLKSLHCLQEVVLEETKSVFLQPDQDSCILGLINELYEVDKDELHKLADRMGGVQGIIVAYRKCIEVFASFMSIYPNLLPAETYMGFKNKSKSNIGIATCSYSDIKSFYQDAYEALMALFYIPVCIDNIIIRHNYDIFPNRFKKSFNNKKYDDMQDDYEKYRVLDNGYKLSNIVASETMQGSVAMPAKSALRNGIGHNNIKYDGISQIVTAYDLKDPNKVKVKISLMDMAIECIGLVKSAVVISEILLYMLRQEARTEGIKSIMHPRFYKDAMPNNKCSCGSGLKYKKCCRSGVEEVLRSNMNL